MSLGHAGQERAALLRGRAADLGAVAQAPPLRAVVVPLIQPELQVEGKVPLEVAAPCAPHQHPACCRPAAPCRQGPPASHAVRRAARARSLYQRPVEVAADVKAVPHRLPDLHTGCHKGFRAKQCRDQTKAPA